MKSVIDESLAANRDVDLNGVPRSTLKDHLSERFIHGTQPGSKAYIAVDEEADFLFALILHICCWRSCFVAWMW